MQSASRARRGSKVRSFTTLSALGGYLARSNAVNRQLELYLKAVTRFGRRQDAVTSPLVKISSKILHVFFFNFSCDLPAIPGILQRHKHAKGTQLCVTVPL